MIGDFITDDRPKVFAPRQDPAPWSDYVADNAKRTADAANNRLRRAGFNVAHHLRRSDKESYSILRVALRNALLRVSESNTDLCPSWMFRRIEAGTMSVGEATDILASTFRQMGDARWLDGVEGTAVALLSEAG